MDQSIKPWHTFLALQEYRLVDGTSKMDQCMSTDGNLILSSLLSKNDFNGLNKFFPIVFQVLIHDPNHNLYSLQINLANGESTFLDLHINGTHDKAMFSSAYENFLQTREVIGDRSLPAEGFK